MAGFLGVLIGALAADMALWHLVVMRIDAGMPVGIGVGLAAGLLIIVLSPLSKRKRLILSVAMAFSALLSLALIVQMPLVQPLAAKALAAVAALALALFGFRLYLRQQD